MILQRFDKLHRLFRDLKLALAKTCCGVFYKCQLFTTHIWGVNYRPFGTGVFGTTKQYLLKIFMEVVTIDDAVFIKYGAMIAHQWGMSFGTREERELVLEEVGKMESFALAGEVPKNARWMAWNGRS